MLSFGQAFATPEHAPFLHTGKSGRAWLLIHGFPGSPAESLPFARIFDALGDTTSGILLPGFGAQMDDLRYKTAQDWMQHAQAEFRQLRAQHEFVGVVGFSMGGAIAAQVAATEKPDALMLLAPFWTLNNVLWSALPVLKRVIPKFKPFRLFKPNWNDPNFVDSVQKFMPQANLADNETRQAVEAFEIPVAMIDQIRQTGARGYAALPNIACPTLVIQGKHDELVTPTRTQTYVKQFKNTPKYVEVNAPHTLFDTSLPSWAIIERTMSDFAKEHAHG
jgi:carboxylesterase